MRSLAVPDVLVVAALLGVAAVVRVPYLLDIPRFTDEVNEAYRGLLIAQGRLLPLTNVDPYVGPLWNYLLAGVFLLAGPGLAGPRVVVALLGILAIVPSYLLGRSIGGCGRTGRAVGALTALFLALSPVHIAVNSHIAWSNCLTPLLTTLALWLTHRAVAADRPAALGWAGLAWGLALQSHPTAALFLPGVVAAVALARPRWLRTRWPWLAVGLTLVACSVLLIANVLTGFAGIQVGMLVQERYSGGDVLDLEVYRRRLSATLSLLSDSLGGALTETEGLRPLLDFPLGLILIMLVLLGLDLTTRRRGWLLVLAVTSYVLLLPAVNGRFESSVPKARYVAPLLPLCYVAIAMLVVDLYRHVGQLAPGLPATAPITPMRLGGVARLAIALGTAGLVLAPLANLQAYYRESAENGRTNDALYRTIAAIDAARRPDEQVHVDRALDRAYTLGGGQWIEHLRFAAGVYNWPRQPVTLPKAPNDPPPAITGLLVVAAQNVPIASTTLLIEPVDTELPEQGPVRIFRVVGPRQQNQGLLPPTAPPHQATERPSSEVFVTGVPMPAGLTFAPDGRLFFNQVLEGLVRIASPAGVLQAEPFVTLPTTKGLEQGALGLALDPDYAVNHWVYVFYSEADDQNRPIRNRVVRFTERDGLATEATAILGDLPINTTRFYNGDHNGGRLRFGPDGKLYVSVGEMVRRAVAQDPRALQGKILRVNKDGSVPDDNPFPGSPAYAVGFRNVWGLAFHPVTGRLYATDNGPRGYDELNLVLPGLNYGYPTIEGGRGERPGLVDPIWDSGEERLGIAGGDFYRGDRFPVYRGDFFFCAFNSGALRRVRLGGPAFDRVDGVETVAEDCRLDVADGPDGTLYFADMFQIRRLVPRGGLRPL